MALKAAANRLAAGQTELDLAIGGSFDTGAMPILYSQTTHCGRRNVSRTGSWY